MCVSHAETTWVGSLEIQCMCIDNCRDVSFVSSHIVNSKSEEALTIYIANLKCSIPVIPNPTPLCKQHYHMLYNILWPTQRHCITCSTSLWHGSSRTCPSLNIIQNYLHDNTEFDIYINEQDKVCLTCYKSHLLIIEESKNNNAHGDSELDDLITIYVST